MLPPIPEPLNKYFESLDTLKILGFEQLALTNAPFQATPQPETNNTDENLLIADVTYLANTSLQVGNVRVPITAYFPADEDIPWLLTLQPESVALAGAAGVMDWVGAGNLLTQWPQELQRISDFTLSAFNISFDPTDQSDALVSLGLTSSSMWTAVPLKLILEKIGFEMQVAHHLGEQQIETLIQQTIKANLRVASSLLNVNIYSSLDEDWLLKADLWENESLPVLADLSSLTGNVTSALPSYLPNSQNYPLTDLKIYFNPTSKTISSVIVTLAVPNHLSDPLAFVIDTTHTFMRLTIPYSENKPGVITHQLFFALNDLEIPAKPDQATQSTTKLTAQWNGAPISLADIAQEVLPFETAVPLGLPNFQFTTLTFVGDLTNGLLTIQGQTDTEWVFDNNPALIIRQTSLTAQWHTAMQDTTTQPTIMSNFHVIVQGDVIKAPPTDFSIKKFVLNFIWNGGESWKVTGDIDLDLFTQKFTLSELSFLQDETLSIQQLKVTAVTQA